MRINPSSIKIVLAFACLGSAGPSAVSQTLDDFCGTGVWAMYLPEDENHEAPNLTSQPITFTTLDDRCAATANEAEVKKLHEAVKAAAIAAFSSSKWAFKVRIKFKLLPDEDAQSEIQTAGAPEVANGMLTDFDNRIAKLKNYRSEKGLFYVMFEYAVAKAT